MKVITIIVDAQGHSTVEAHGHTGRTCLAATEAWERALGKVQHRQLKPEYYCAPVSTHQHQPLGTPQDQR